MVNIYPESYNSRYLSFTATKMRSNAGKLYVPQDLVNTYKNDAGWKAELINYGCQILPIEGSPYEEPGSVSALYS